MRYLKDLGMIDWKAVGDEYLDLAPRIRDYIESSDPEERTVLLGEIWEDILPDGEYLTEATSYVIEFVTPLLEDERRGDEAHIIVNLARACWAAVEHRELYYGPDCEPSKWRTSTLRAVEEGFEAFLRVFSRRPDLRVLLSFIITCFPERAKPHLAQIISQYEASHDQYEKSALLVSLDQVAPGISNWDEMLLAAIANDGAPVLQRFATCLYMVHHGREAPRPFFSLLANASPDEVHPYPFLPVGLPHTEILGRALRALPANERIAILVSILPRVKWTATAQCLVSYLLEAASTPGIRLGRELGSGEFRPLTTPPVRPLRVDPNGPDWIPAVVNCEPFWTDAMSGVDVKTDLLSLFGLPLTRAGLIDLWRSIHGKPFPGLIR